MIGKQVVRCKALFVLALGTSIVQQGFAEDQTETAKNKLEIEEITVYGRSRTDSLREIPQTTAVFDADFMEDVAANDVRGVVRFVPSATPVYSEVGWRPMDFSIRGFDAAQTVNGTSRNQWSHPIDMQYVERVEVLMGPASVLYGAMEPGAVINIVTKKPRNEFHAEASVEFGSYNNQRYAVDVGGPLSDRVRARLNVAYSDQETFLDFWSTTKTLVAPVVEFDLTPDTLLTLEATYSRQYWPAGGYLGTPAAGLLTENPNGDYPRSFFPTDPALDEGGTQTRKGARYDVTLKHAFNDSWSVRFAASYYDSSRSEATIIALPRSDQRTLNRLMVVHRGPSDDYSWYLDLTGAFETGPVNHQFSIGVDYTDDTGEDLGVNIPVPAIDLYNPVYGFSLPNNILYNHSVIKSETRGVFIQDRMSVGERLHLIAGLRYASIETSNDFTRGSTGVTTTSSNSQSDWPTTIGAVYDVNEGFSLFANRSESFLPRSGTTSGGSTFPPETSEQFEAGAKFDIGSTGLTGNVALFRIEKPNVLTPDPDNIGFQVPLGSVKSRGVELSAQGQPLPNWSFYAAYSYMTTDVRSNDPNLDGAELRRAPGNTLTLFSRYDIQQGALEGLGFSGSVQYVDSFYLDAGNSLLAPSYARVDLGAYYALNDRVEFSLLARNVTDEDIFNGISSLFVSLDPPRTYLAGIKFKM